MEYCELLKEAQKHEAKDIPLLKKKAGAESAFRYDVMSNKVATCVLW